MLLTFRTKREGLAWCAGFFEGEGCFTRGKAKRRQNDTQLIWLNASLTQKNRPLLELFQETVGFGVVYGPRTNGVFEWKTNRKGESEQLLKLFEGVLSERRISTASQIMLEAEISSRHKRAPRPMKIPTCGHPEAKHQGKGLCTSCYMHNYDRTQRKRGDQSERLVPETGL